MSSSMPMLTKKKLMNTSWKGSTLPVAWMRCSLSLMMRPAKKAPRARLRPMLLVSQAVAKQMETMLAMKSSRLRVRTTASSRRGTTKRAST